MKEDFSADVLHWDQYNKYLKGLEETEQYQKALYVLMQQRTGYRYQDVGQITPNMIHRGSELAIKEFKTKKQRKVQIPELVTSQAMHYLSKLDIPGDCSILKGKMAKVHDITWMNRKMKIDKERFDLDINNFSTHSMRKGHGWRIFDKLGQDIKAILTVQKVYLHSNMSITVRYLKIDQHEVDQAVLNMD